MDITYLSIRNANDKTFIRYLNITPIAIICLHGESEKENVNRMINENKIEPVDRSVFTKTKEERKELKKLKLQLGIPYNEVVLNNYLTNS